MPIYAYRCKTCFCEFERNSDFEERNNMKCPKCYSETQRLIVKSVSSVSVTNTADRFLGTQVPKDLDKMMEERSKQHYEREDAPQIREEKGEDHVSELFDNLKEDKNVIKN